MRINRTQSLSIISFVCLYFVARADADRMVHQAQSLWSACQALWASVRTGEPGISWQHKLRPLASEVSAVSRSAGKNHKK